MNLCDNCDSEFKAISLLEIHVKLMHEGNHSRHETKTTKEILNTKINQVRDENKVEDKISVNEEIGPPNPDHEEKSKVDVDNDDQDEKN